MIKLLKIAIFTLLCVSIAVVWAKGSQGFTYTVNFINNTPYNITITTNEGNSSCIYNYGSFRNLKLSPNHSTTPVPIITNLSGKCYANESGVLIPALALNFLLNGIHFGSVKFTMQGDITQQPYIEFYKGPYSSGKILATGSNPPIGKKTINLIFQNP